MDPLNGVADIENRELRLVSNYGFIEDPSRMIRAARLAARLGWVLEERTQQRYDTGKAENYIEALGSWERSYELEEIFHEEDPLRIARRLEAEGWGKLLFPQWSSAKANEAEVERLRDAAARGYSTATDLADWLVRTLGVPFRRAHHVTGVIVKRAEALGRDLASLPLAEMQAVEPTITRAVYDVLDIDRSVASRNSYGGTAPDRVRAAIEAARKRYCDDTEK